MPYKSLIFHLHGVFQTLCLHAPAEFMERYEQVCSAYNGAQAEEDAVIIFATLGQRSTMLGSHSLKKLPGQIPVLAQTWASRRRKQHQSWEWSQDS